MLKILIVEDDLIAINGIRLLLSKKNYDLEIFEARNGKLALEILENTPIDILFTDVDMPIVTGIQLAQQVQQFYPAIKIIFFSAYSDFAYMQSAIHLSAVSYLLKPIQPQEFYDVMDRTISLCQKEAGNTSTVADKESLDKIMVKRDVELYLSDLFLHCETDTDTSLLELPVLTDANNATIQIVFLHSNLPLLSSQRKEFEQLLRKITNVPVEFYVISSGYGIILLDLSGNKRLLLNWDIWWQSFKQDVHKMNQNLLFLAIRTKLISTMQDMVSEMRAIRRMLLLNHYIRETTLVKTEYDHTGDATSFEVDRIMKEMGEHISCKKFHLLSEKLHALVTTLLYNHAYSFFYTKHLLLNLVQEIEKEVPKEFVCAIAEVKASLLASPDILQSEEILQKMLQNLEEMQNQKLSSDNRYIHQIQTIILSDCASNLDLTTIADRVNLSVTYMCTLFKKETGISIGQYIKDVRMNKARELLHNTNLRLNDIYPQVGYSSLTYFCIAFKETYGITPTQFRQKEVNKDSEVNQDE